MQSNAQCSRFVYSVTMLADTPDEPTWLNERMVPAEVNKLEIYQGKYEKYCEYVYCMSFLNRA